MLPVQYFNSQAEAAELLGYFLLLDGSTFQLLDGTNFLLFNSTAFNPNNYSSTILWLDAQDPNNNGTIPSNGTLQNNWYDKSISKLVFNNSTTTQMPLNVSNGITTFNSIYFGNNGLSYLTSTKALTLGSSNSISMVFKITDSNARYILDCLTSPELYLRMIVPGYVQAGVNISGTDYGMIAEQIANNTPFVMTYIFNATGTALIFLNGQLQTGASYSPISSAVTTQIQIGSNVALTQNYNGYLGELIVGNVAWTTAQRQQIELYLSSKWGIAF